MSTMAIVSVSRDGLTYVDYYNPRNGEWARRAAYAAAERGLAKALDERAKREANHAHPLWGHYLAARKLSLALMLRAPDVARAASSVTDALRRMLPYPSLT